MSTRGGQANTQGRSRQERPERTITTQNGGIDAIRAAIGSRGVRTADQAVAVGKMLAEHIANQPNIAPLYARLASEKDSTERLILRQEIEDRTREAERAALRQLHPMGDMEGRFVVPHQRGSDYGDSLVIASQYVPHAWLETLAHPGQFVSLRVKGDGPSGAYYDEKARRIAVTGSPGSLLTPNPFRDIAIAHELVHAVTLANPLLGKIEHSYVTARTKSGKAFGLEYAGTTKSRREGLLGRKFGHEVLSTGVESLIGGKPGTPDIRQVDPEQYYFVLGALAGVPAGT